VQLSPHAAAAAAARRTHACARALSRAARCWHGGVRRARAAPAGAPSRRRPSPGRSGQGLRGQDFRRQKGTSAAPPPLASPPPMAEPGLLPRLAQCVAELEVGVPLLAQVRPARARRRLWRGARRALATASQLFAACAGCRARWPCGRGAPPARCGGGLRRVCLPPAGVAAARRRAGGWPRLRARASFAELSGRVRWRAPLPRAARRLAARAVLPEQGAPPAPARAPHAPRAARAGARRPVETPALTSRRPRKRGFPPNAPRAAAEPRLVALLGRLPRGRRALRRRRRRCARRGGAGARRAGSLIVFTKSQRQNPPSCSIPAG
jgi:hypothetical protein